MELQLALPPGAPPTTLTLLQYADRVVVSLAQAPAFSTVLSASPAPDGEGGIAVEAKTLLGDREDAAATFFGKTLGEAVIKATGKPLVLMLGLKKPAPCDDGEGDAEGASFALLRAALAAVQAGLVPCEC